MYFYRKHMEDCALSCQEGLCLEAGILGDLNFVNDKSCAVHMETTMHLKCGQVETCYMCSLLLKIVHQQFLKLMTCFKINDIDLKLFINNFKINYC